MRQPIHRPVFSLLVLALGAFFAVFFSLSASAQEYPAHTIRIIVPWAPGGGTDILTRTLLPKLTEALGQAIVVENKPGGGSIIGVDYAAHADPDGYTLVVNDTSLVTSPFLHEKLPYDTIKDLQPVSLIATAPVILVVHPSLPVKSVAELVALAKAKPGELTFASGGNGTSTHLGVELLKAVAGIEMVHVPYKGTGPAVTDLVGGHVNMLMGGISSARSHVEEGRLRALAVTGEQRSLAMPEVPTFKELGYAGVNSSSYWGLLAPAGTPRPIVDRLSREVAKALADPAVIQRLHGLGYDLIGGSADEYAANIKSEMAKWGPVIAKAGIKAG
jgi:tripartite-type tricarboxylate transporter receptor subunit TctC